MIAPVREATFHKSMENLLRTWRKDPSCTQVIIIYGVSSETKSAWAVIKKSLSAAPIEIKLPSKPYPSTWGWRDWFTKYFEPEMKILLDEIGLDARVVGNKGSLLKLMEREKYSEEW